MARFLGYRIPSTNIKKIEEVLATAKTNLRTTAMEEYHRLLSEEIAEIVDDITLNIVQRPEYPILDEAVNRLNQRIIKAERTNQRTEYNLFAGVTVIPDKKYTYLLPNIANARMIKTFSRTKGLEDFSYAEMEVLQGLDNGRAAKWNELHNKTELTEGGLVMTVILTNQVKVNPDRLLFAPPAERAKVRARRNMTSKLLNLYAMGDQIKDYQLMAVLDKALMALTTEEAEQEMNEMTKQLTATLIDITRELVITDPRKPIESEKPEESNQQEIQTDKECPDALDDKAEENTAPPSTEA